METENLELYRKYRPSKLDEIVGNETTIKSLKKEIENGSHTFLFTGPAGCGKTTLARIMAKEVGASELSIHEINSSENRGIDTARDIMQQMRYSPIDGGKNVYILDECHQWLNPVQNAFLKALEDTPKNTYFFLCTTDPQKLITPLKTRCSMIAVKPLTNEEMTYLLKRTARSEKIKISPDVCEKICELSFGSARQGLKFLNKVLFLDDEEEQLELLNSINLDDNSETIELCRVLLDKTVNWNKLAKILSSLNLSEPEKIRQAVMGYMNACLLKGTFNVNINAAIQAFSSADTYKNGKFAITVACLDFLSLLD